jgi:hypothetical protein
MTAGPVKGNIQLGDLIRALSRLGWKDGHVQAIAACLGFDISQLPDKKPAHEISDPRLTDQQNRKPSHPGPAHGPVSPPRPELPPPMPRIKSGNQQLTERTERAQPANLDHRWSYASETLLTQPSLEKLARINLFPDRVSRHLFNTALSTQRPGRDIDIGRLIERICHEPVNLELPKTIETTLDAGCQLLRDFGHSMAPWHEDLVALERQVRDIIGAARLHAYNFDSLPLEPMRWTPEGKRDYWRADGRPVLVATDFGVQGAVERPRLDAPWREFIEICRQAAAPLVFLTPWPERYSPRDLGAYARLVHWSPRTTVAMIKRHPAGRTR